MSTAPATEATTTNDLGRAVKEADHMSDLPFLSDSVLPVVEFIDVGEEKEIEERQQQQQQQQLQKLQNIEPLFSSHSLLSYINNIYKKDLDWTRVACMVTCAISCSISLLIQYYGMNLLLYGIFKTIAASCFLLLALYNWRGPHRSRSKQQHLTTSSISQQRFTDGTISKTGNGYSLVQEQFGLIVVVGQAFSLVGDVLLVWCEIHDLFFLSGGLFFAMAHICYMLSYLTLLSSKKFKMIDWGWLLGMSIFVSCMTWYCIVRGILQYIQNNAIMSTFIWIYAVMISMMVALSPAGDSLASTDETLTGNEAIGAPNASSTLFYDHVKAVEGRIELNQRTKSATATTPLQQIWNSKFIYRTLGSVVFYLSDLCVARQKFMVDEFMNVAVGLPLYFIAQLLIASSI